jgi:hypothetical protein
MKKIRYWLLFIVGLFVALGVSVLQDTPGYMDADYYFYGGLRLADGFGFTEMILWNFLDDPAGLPHPSHTYWMPLPSIIAAFGITLFRFLDEFTAAQVGFVLIVASIPPLTAAVCMSLTRQERKATYAGMLSLFAGYFLPVSTTTDSFGLYMLLGGLFFLLVGRDSRSRLLFLGIISGLMHLTRADGILWLLVAVFVLVTDQKDNEGTDLKTRQRVVFSRDFLIQVGEILFGYLIVMSLWYLRNIRLFGTLFPPGGGQTLWMLHYDELFSYPVEMLTFERWWASGLGEIIRGRADALWLNLQSGFAVQGLVVLGPLALIGAWQKRETKAVRMGWVAWSLILGLMTVVFPFSGARGGFFHSGAAFMPMIWALVPVGLDGLSNWTVKRFDWEVRKISPFFHGLVVLVVFLISLSLLSTKILGSDSTSQPTWDEEARSFLELEDRLRTLGANPDDIVLVNNPPGYAHVSDRAAIVIPNGDMETLKMVIQRYKPRYVLLGLNHPRGLDELYEQPENQSGLIYLETVTTTHIFSIDEGGD